MQPINGTPGKKISTGDVDGSNALDTPRRIGVQQPPQANVIKRQQNNEHIATATPRPRLSSKENAVSASTLLDRVAPPDDAAGCEVDPAQLQLPLTWDVAPGIPSVPRLPRHLRLVGSEAADTRTPPVASSAHPPQPLAPGALQGAWVARIARAIAEVADGDRPAAQLSRWVERAPLAKLHARGAAFRRHPAVRDRRRELSAVRAAQQVRAVRLCPVAPGVVESSAVLVGGGRGRAIALRFEARGAEWIVTAVDIG